VNLTVNGAQRSFDAPPLKRLLDVLREDLGLTGTKEGCGEGECGACSVLVDGELVNSCLVAVCQVDGAQVLTVEGLAASSGELSLLQRCFLERGGAQCGICTPGMVVAAHRFLQSGTPATSENVREAIAGNLCRCTGYAKIVEAIQLAAEGGR
jgi:aerobic carbon-monoxide dehydrogenase small subunit